MLRTVDPIDIDNKTGVASTHQEQQKPQPQHHKDPQEYFSPTSTQNYTSLLQKLENAKLKSCHASFPLSEISTSYTSINQATAAGDTSREGMKAYIQWNLRRLGDQVEDSEQKIKEAREEMAWLRLQAFLDVRPKVLPMELIMMVKEWMIVVVEEEDWRRRVRVDRAREVYRRLKGDDNQY